jgi:hypothetical protein
MRCSGFANEHPVQATLVLLPAGALYRGTPKHDSIGKVHTHRIAHLVLACERGSIHPLALKRRGLLPLGDNGYTCASVRPSFSFLSGPSALSGASAAGHTSAAATVSRSLAMGRIATRNS